MKRAAAIVLVLASLAAEAGPRFKRFCGRTRDGVTKRGLDCANYAAFELGPLDGAGMGSACACANVTSAQGGALTVTRASSAWCSKQGTWQSTGIIPGDLVSCGNNLPRVEADGSGFLGLQFEYSATNLLLRSEEIDNGAWANTATVTANAATAPNNATAADVIDDTSAVAVQSATQVYVVGGTATYTPSVFCRAGTLSAVTLTAAGSGGGTVTCSATGLGATNYTRLGCASTSLTTNITLTITPGDNPAAAVTGSVQCWGAMLEATSLGMRSYITSVAAAGTRAIDTPTASRPAALAGNSYCARAYVTPNFNGTVAGNSGLLLGTGSNDRWLFRASGSSGRISAFNGSVQVDTGADVPYVRGTAQLFRVISTGAAVSLVGGAGTVGPSAFTAATPGATFEIGGSVAVGGTEGVISRIMADPDQSRCN